MMQCSVIPSWLHVQVSELLQEKAALQKQNQQRAVRLESLDTSPTALQSDKDALARNLSHVRTTVQRGSADLTPHQG